MHQIGPKLIEGCDHSWFDKLQLTCIARG